MPFLRILRQGGLPQTELPAALLAFNLGVEAGQVAFIGVLMASGALLSRALWSLGRAGSWEAVCAGGRLGSVYVIGTLAVMWTVERAASF